MDYEVEVALYIVVAVILTVSFFLLFFLGPIKNFFRKHLTIRSYYTYVRKIALENDFYLINKFSMELEGADSGFHIDHILFGDKFIYVIKDFHYKGALAAKEEDDSWVYFYRKNAKKYIKNPMIINSIRCDRLAVASGLDRSYFISVVLVNDDVFITPIKTKSTSSVIIPLSKLSKFITVNERREDVEKFSQEDLEIAVNDLAELNTHEK